MLRDCVGDKFMSMTAAKAELPATLPPPAVSDLDDAPELIIKPRKGWIAIDWSELVRYRELLYFLIWRDVKVRYKQAVLGVAWAVLQPVFAMLVYTMFGKIGGFQNKISFEGPLHVWIYAGLLPWMFFATSIGMGGMSLVSQQHLLTKIYFPRMFMPTATIGGALFDMCISACVFTILMLSYGIIPSWNAVFIPLESLSPKMQYLASINPFTGIIDAFRAAIFTDHPWRPVNLLISGLSTTVIFVFGLFYFRKTERRFADIA